MVHISSSGAIIIMPHKIVSATMNFSEYRKRTCRREHVKLSSVVFTTINLRFRHPVISVLTLSGDDHMSTGKKVKLIINNISHKPQHKEPYSDNECTIRLRARLQTAKKL
uniref:Uncharacterized protein n=1 Tax=Glossina pallidipes TaxID=7398 RepID=A0A1A9ZTX2_GLOPL